MDTQHLFDLKIAIQIDLIELIPAGVNLLRRGWIWLLDTLNCVIEVREIIAAHWFVIEVWRLLFYLIAIETIRYFASKFVFFKF
jgi:hypothetical protein